MCKYCDGKNGFTNKLEEKEFMTFYISNVALNMEIYLPTRVIETKILINYCPMCGRKLEDV